MAGNGVLVVGGSRGIGFAVASAFAAAGHPVAVIARQAPAATPGIACVQADLERGDATAAAVDAFLASHGTPGSVVFCQRARGGADAWESEVRVSLGATRQVIEALAGPMAAAGGGAIAVVGSVANQFVAGEQPVGYHVAKAGLAQMVRYYAVTLGPKGIRVNGVVPGSVDKRPGEAHPDQAIVPLRRVATPADVAGVVLFLCGEQAACVTGQHITVDSGLSLLWQGSLAQGPRP